MSIIDAWANKAFKNETTSQKYYATGIRFKNQWKDQIIIWWNEKVEFVGVKSEYTFSARSASAPVSSTFCSVCLRVWWAGPSLTLLLSNSASTKSWPWLPNTDLRSLLIFCEVLEWLGKSIKWFKIELKMRHFWPDKEPVIFDSPPLGGAHSFHSVITWTMMEIVAFIYQTGCFRCFMFYCY